MRALKFECRCVFCERDRDRKAMAAGLLIWLAGVVLAGFALFATGCDGTEVVTDPVLCAPAAVDLNLNLPCATSAHPVDTYGYPDDGLYIDAIGGEPVFVVRSCDQCSPVRP